MLERKEMARSTFYYHTKRMKEPDPYESLRIQIERIYRENRGRYGYRRITAQLCNEGICVNHKLVQKLMSQMELRAKRRRQHYHSYKGEIGRVAPNILERNFKADKPNTKWTTDVTQVNIHDRKIYLSPILDMYNGEVISYSTSYSPDLRMVTTMLKKAFDKYESLDGLVFHSDQGWHYQHYRYQKMLSEKGIIQSMSRKGNCLDNAMMENFFGLMKTELLYTQEWESVEQFEQALRKYIHYYNNDRIKLRLKGKSPVQYRTLYQ